MWNRTSTSRALQNDLQQTTGVYVVIKNSFIRVHKGGMKAQTPLVGPVLTSQHHVARLVLARFGRFVDIKESGDAVRIIMQPETSSRMTGLAVGQ